MQQTMRHHAARPLTTARDMSAVPCSKIVSRVKAMVNGPGMANPDTHAVEFYARNHLAAMVRSKFLPDEPLGEADSVVDDYYEWATPAAIRMFYYLLLICTRESRHATTTEGKVADLPNGAAIKKFADLIRGEGSSTAYGLFLDTPPACSLGEWSTYLVHHFEKSSFGSQYGGKAWAEIAKVLRAFIFGEYTAEMMIDTAFTLSHNNGPIFNKGMLYQNYSSGLLTLLDIQRSGQVPEAVLENHPLLGNVPGATKIVLKDAIAKAVRLTGVEVGSYIDWWKVEALGAKTTVYHYKEQQAEKHGLSPLATPAEKLAAEQEALKVAADKAVAAALAAKHKAAVADHLKQQKITAMAEARKKAKYLQVMVTTGGPVYVKKFKRQPQPVQSTAPDVPGGASMKHETTETHFFVSSENA